VVEETVEAQVSVSQGSQADQLRVANEITKTDDQGDFVYEKESWLPDENGKPFRLCRPNYRQTLSRDHF
jgi:hypothetical protein